MHSTKKRKYLRSLADKNGEIECIDCKTKYHVNSSTQKGQRHITVDHEVPLSRSGPDHTSNFRPRCLLCNNMKGALLPVEYEVLIKYMNDKPLTIKESRILVNALLFERGTITLEELKKKNKVPFETLIFPLK